MDLLKNYLLTEVLDSESKAAVKKHETSPEIPRNRPMTPEEFAAQMQEAYEEYYLKDNDEEVVHIVMDGIMCSLLRLLGYGEGIDIFNNTPKWYA